MSRYPELVPECVCHTDVIVNIHRGLNIDGSPKTVASFETKCNYSEKSHWVTQPDRQLIRLSSIALFGGDIAPGMDLQGELVVKNAGGSDTIRRIYSAERARNPDGTVNFTKLELI